MEMISKQEYSAPEKIHRAGMICYRIMPGDVVQMKFMIPSAPAYGGTDPQLPKGRIDPGETAKEAAIREAQEEIGLFVGSIIGDVYELGVFLGRTTVFMCRVSENAFFGIPDEETDQVVWLTADEFAKVGRELHRPIVRIAHDRIRSIEELDD